MNHKKERFKVFEVELRLNRGRAKVEPGSNRDDVIINLIINKNKNKGIKSININKID